MTNAQMTAISNPLEGSYIYCMDCNPKGPYFYNGTAWLSFVTGNQTAATLTAATLACTGTLAGTYQEGLATTSSNTKTVTVTVASVGSYTATTNTVNGVQFSGSGIFSSTGANMQIVLTASGPPSSAGAFTYTVTLAGQTCTFSITYAAAATFACGSATQTQSPTGALVNGNSYSGTYTIPYTAGNGSSYGSTTLTQNGLTLTRTAGTLASGGGNVAYSLSGTYTGTTGTVTFSVPEGCAVLYGDAIRGALASAGCASCTAYDAAAVNTWVMVTASEYAALANTTLIANAAKAGASDANMNTVVDASGNSIGFSPDFTVGGSNTFTTVPASSYLIGFKTGRYSSGSVTGSNVKVGTAVNSGYTTFNGTIPAYSTAALTFYHFVAKKPSATTANSVGYLGSYLGGPGSSLSGLYGPVSASGYFGSGDVSTLGTSGYALQIQAIGTTTKQW